MVMLLLVGCFPPSPFPEMTPTPLPAATGTASPTGDEGEAVTDASEEFEAYEAERRAMVEETIAARGVSDPAVLRAMRTVPRHVFVPEKYGDEAYADHPLPIGHGQTISQPYIVAWMTELLELQPGEKVLEIGTGSGYQAAVLAELEGVEIYSIEIIPELAEDARADLHSLGYGDDEMHLKQGDGYFGWEEHAPFDAIVVTAAPDHLPQPLARQLADGGRIVIPIGPPGGYQTLWRFTKEGGDLKSENLGSVAFVPFTGEGAPGPGGNPRP
ncbi:MAG: protein-L-isoaspartate(D-aspartate) O-methyltransferase [Anaerolineales bacterium]